MFLSHSQNESLKIEKFNVLEMTSVSLNKRTHITTCDSQVSRYFNSDYPLSLHSLLFSQSEKQVNFFLSPSLRSKDLVVMDWLVS